ncbi:MAG TPA: cytochrome P450 [Kribbella sp.]|nr:cytochrome P450 [Kribbella sp.]
MDKTSASLDDVQGPARAADDEQHLAVQRNTQRTQEARSARDEAAAAGTLAWDPFDPAWMADPYSVYARLRETSPVHRSPLGFWVFTRHADCLSILRDRGVSSDTRNRDKLLTTGRDSDTATPVDPSRPRSTLDEALDELIPFIFRDPPDHTRLRGLVQKAFTPRVIQGLQPRIEQICAELLDAALERREIDLVADYAYPLPVRIISEILGVPPEDRTRFQQWSDALTHGLDPEFLLSPEAITQRTAGMLSFVQYFADLISQRRANPGDDLITRLIQAEEHGDVLSPMELIATCLLLLVAGHETTVSLISGGALALIEHPDQLARFRDDPGVAASGIEEMLRFVSPVQLTTRIATQTMRFGDFVVEEGDACMLLIGSANRDPDVFTAPDTFDVGRADNPHLGFGLGIHHCLGAPLARLESRIALSALVRRVGRWERTTHELAYKDNIALRGLASLPVDLTPA